MTKIFVLMCGLCAVWVNGQLYDGDRCITQNGQPGKCAKISACIPVRNDIYRGIENHVVCGYEGFEQIACCPNAKPVVTKPTTRQPVVTKPTTRRPVVTMPTTRRPVVTMPTTRQSVVTKPTTRRPVSARISARKCDEYSEFVYEKTYITTILEVVEQKTAHCAFTSVPLIVGGTEAKIREFPHMALIGFEDGNTIRWDCGGTLISEQFVLTAAHCLYKRDYGDAKYIRLGEHDQSRTDDGKTIDLRIIERIRHPEYQYPIHYNDIGLFKLERRVELSGAIRPACLPQVSAVPTKTAIASGWGAVTSTGKQSNVLLKVVLDMFSQRECDSSYRNGIKNLEKGILEETQVCAGSHTEVKDTCQGDSGGPLQIYHSNPCSYTVIGVTSIGKECGTIGTPGVYTRVYPYLSWVEKIVWPNQ